MPSNKTFPGVNELFTSPERADGHQKWMDFSWHARVPAEAARRHLQRVGNGASGRVTILVWKRKRPPSFTAAAAVTS
jgi:hypothetical protein